MKGKDFLALELGYPSIPTDIAKKTVKTVEYPYSRADMDFTEINSHLDAAIIFFEGVVDRENNYKQQIADKDKQIADLQGQLTTVSNTVEADESELTQLHDKLTKLVVLVNPTTTA